jgi:hypothetical protein
MARCNPGGTAIMRRAAPMGDIRFPGIDLDGPRGRMGTRTEAGHTAGPSRQGPIRLLRFLPSTHGGLGGFSSRDRSSDIRLHRSIRSIRPERHTPLRLSTEEVAVLKRRLGSIPRVAGFSREELQVLVALSRHPRGLTSTRQVAEAAGISFVEDPLATSRTLGLRL